MRHHKAFSMIELMVVVVILGILAAVVVPRFAGATEHARTASTESTVAAVRASIAAFRTAAVIAGDEPFPTIAELTDGTAVRFDIPANPFTGSTGVQTVSEAQARDRAVFNTAGAGWNYFVDNAAEPPIAVFYANSDAPTTNLDNDDQPVTANDL